MTIFMLPRSLHNYVVVTLGTKLKKAVDRRIHGSVLLLSVSRYDCD